MSQVIGKHPTAEQVLAKVRVLGADECWPWTGRPRKHYDGRGVEELFGRTHSAPRVVWAIHAKVMPPAHLYVCHTCNNPTCCNPAHLYLGTHAENMRYASLHGRTVGQKKTHCPLGHPYSEENTYLEQRREGGTRRHCRICRSDWQKAFKLRRAA